jgi:predicted oxidoreductase
MANNPPHPPLQLPAAFRPASTLTAASSVSQGTKMTVSSQCFISPVKLEFNVPATQHAFNLNKAHIIKAKDPSLEIFPSKTGQAKFTDLLQFSANKKDYRAMFHHAIDKQPTEACKIIVKHSLITNQKFSDLKFQNAKLMDYMFANQIWIRYNQSNTLQMAALGFMQGVHP